MCRSLLVLLVSGGAAPARAADAPDFFGQITTGAGTGDGETAAKPGGAMWSANGFVKQQYAYALDDQVADLPFSRRDAGTTQWRSTLNLSLHGALPGNGNYRVSANGFYDSYYHGPGRDRVTPEEYEDQVNEAEWREVFVNIEPAPNLWLKFGRQIVAWGESDFTQILDLVNPRDAREIGLVDLEDARLPIWATRLSYVGRRWGTDVVATHAFEPNRLAKRGADFDPFIRLRSALTIRDDREPDADLGGDVLWRGFASFARGDVGLIYGRVHDHNPILRRDSGGTTFTPAYPRIKAAGITANFVTGYWLYKTEYARKRGARFARDDWAGQLDLPAPRLYDEKQYDQVLLGVEYSGVTDTQLSFESVTGRIRDYESALLPRRADTVLSGRISRNFLRDTANVELVWAHWLEPRGDSVRLAFSYNLTDAWKFTVGGITYAATDVDALLYPYRRNDRLYASVRYSFED